MFKLCAIEISIPPCKKKEKTNKNNPGTLACYMGKSKNKIPLQYLGESEL